MAHNKVIPINVLHVALEWGPATFGGLGRVATQMVQAQGSSIITPYYPDLYKDLKVTDVVAEVTHLFNNEIVKSKIYLAEQNNAKIYLLAPDTKYKDIFAIQSKPAIYADTEVSNFIDRVKYLNSAVAAYVNDPKLGERHPQPHILQLHDWQAALVPKLLKELHNNTKIKSVFMVHIDNGDRGTFSTDSLYGIGLQFNKDTTILKAIGLMYSDKIVAVSPRFLRECIETISDDPEAEFLRKIFAWSSIQNKTIGIANGINYTDFCPLGKLIQDPQNIYQEKLRLKQQLAHLLCGSRLTWKFDPNLPLILCVTRYSPEKGPEVFEQVIKQIAGRATFIAIGRGMTEDVFRVLIKHSRQTDNVFVTASEKEQAQIIELARAAADIMLVPSHRDALNVTAIEGQANGSLIVTTGVGGIKDAVNPDSGIFYEDRPEGGHNPALTAAINNALTIWENSNPTQINAMQTHILQEAQKFDWLAPGGALEKYQSVYSDLLSQEPVVANKAALYSAPKLHMH